MRSSSGGTYGNAIGRPVGYQSQEMHVNGIKQEQQKRVGDMDDVSDEADFEDIDENVIHASSSFKQSGSTDNQVSNLQTKSNQSQS